MKKITIAPTIIALGLALIFTGCGSAPAPEPAPVEETQSATVEEEQNETDVQESSAEEDDSSKQNQEEEIRRKNQETFEGLENSRKNAIDAGAAELFPELWNSLEEQYNALKARMENGEDVSAEMAALNKKYLALKALCDAKAKKEKIDSLEIAQYSQKSYDEATALLEELSGAKDIDDVWCTKAFDTNKKYDEVLDAGLRQLAKQERNKAYEAKKQADSVKCAVSKKDAYKEYLENFKKGDACYTTKDVENALKEYTKAKEGFSALYTQVSQAREKAQKAIDEAKERVQQSENTALQADIEKPLEDGDIDGIEEEDAVLLEEDDFSEAKAAAAESEAAVSDDIDSIKDAEEVMVVDEAEEQEVE